MACLLARLEPLEEGFQWEKIQPWLQKNWTLSIYANAVYVAIIFLGKWWMQDKPAYSLRRPLAMWNTGLAVFSIVNFLTVIPHLLGGVQEHGFMHTTCNRRLFLLQRCQLWGFLYVLSKLVEFGDTAFIVLRKTPLNFLHWYHHISVFSYCSFAVAQADPTAEWFGTANLFVHSVMYSYYVLKATGIRVPRAVAQSITALQLAQFGIGLVVLGVTYIQKRDGIACESRDDVMWAGFIMYGSYFALFSNFFYQRYIRK